MRNFARGRHTFGHSTLLGDAPQQPAVTTSASPPPSGGDANAHAHAHAFQAPLTLDFAALSLTTAGKEGSWIDCGESEDAGRRGGDGVIVGQGDGGSRAQATTMATAAPTAKMTKTSKTKTSGVTVGAGQEGVGSSSSNSSGSGSAVRLYELPVRARAIERRSVPRRARENMSVDALAVMMEQVLGEEAGARRGRGRRRRSEVNGRGLKTGAFGAFGGTEVVWPKEKGEVEEERKSEGNVETEKGVVLLDKLEEEEAADELCFLIDKCDLDSEGKQAMFMPYIT